MATKRMVSTAIWTKSRKFRRIKPLERYVFLYLVTNQEVELCGAYEHPIEDISHFTGLEVEVLADILGTLRNVGLAIYHDGWVIIPGYAASQSAENPKVKTGIEKSLKALPEAIREIVNGDKPESKPMDSPSIDVPSGTHRDEEATANSNSNNNRNNNKNNNSSPPSADSPAKRKAVKGSSATELEKADPLYRRVKESYESKWEGNTLPSYQREGPAIKRLVGEAHARGKDDPEGWARRFVVAHWHLKNDTKSLLASQPFLPSIGMSSGLMPRVLEAMQASTQTAEQFSDRDRRKLAELGVEV